MIPPSTFSDASPALVPIGQTDVPEAHWTATGTLQLRFALSRELRFRPDPVEFRFVESPLFELRLKENPHSVSLKVVMKHDGTLSPDEEKEVVEGELDWAFLKAGETYHFAMTWDAAGGRLNVYLNGALQEELRLRRNSPAWPIPESPSGPLLMHQSQFPEDRGKSLVIQCPEVWLVPQCLSAEEIRASAENSIKSPPFPLTGEGRWGFLSPMDVSGYQLAPLYTADFSKPLDVLKEERLLHEGARVRQPQSEWVLEGRGEAHTQNDSCIVESVPRDYGHALVLWNTRPFPANILIEFTMEPEDPSKGLGIVFFATRALKGGSPFEPGLEERNGIFSRYHSGELNGYHVSYWSANSRPGNILRRTSNLRKNKGFVLCSVGPDHIGGSEPAPRRVRILSFEGHIQVETDGKLALSFMDDGTFFGPAHKGGWIGLRQMGSADRVVYRDFCVWEVRLSKDGEP